MDAYSLLRTLGALATVLGMLAGALWLVRRYNIRLPGGSSGGPSRRLEIVERAALDGRRSVALLRRDGREHLILLAPEGNLMIETGIIRDEIDRAADAVRLEAEREAEAAAKAEAEAMRESFVAMVDKARASMKDKVASVTGTASAPRTEAAEPTMEAPKTSQGEDIIPPDTLAEAPITPMPVPAPAPPSAPAPKRVRTRAVQPKRPHAPVAAKRTSTGTARG